MIVCPNCNHQNPEGAVQCEACYTPLPTSTTCPSCGASVQSDASFCGQCGFNLQSQAAPPDLEAAPMPSPTPVPDLPPLASLEPLIAPEPIAGVVASPSLPLTEAPRVEAAAAQPVPVAATSPTAPVPQHEPVTPAPEPDTNLNPSTQIQFQQAKLLHQQTDSTIELPSTLTTIHLGKPNDRIPPDIDVSGFPNSEIVSRIHAQLRVEGDVYYIEDAGSSNGTYVNNMPLPVGNRHRLRSGDRIALGKGDKVTFLFQSS
ncbi:MAG: FHA domain-containing protein [Leptolyngbya sp. RL_3_1]|nr:FHA domain-containing protein [Leptolyngbya sp. RL_3_1]